jgi:hypothetical protein
LKVLGRGVKGPLAVEVAIGDGGVTLASARSTPTSVFDLPPELCVPFKVSPPASDIRITLTNEGHCTIALRAIEVRAEGWSFELPPLST